MHSKVNLPFTEKQKTLALAAVLVNFWSHAMAFCLAFGLAFGLWC